jgi:hypothetical protein
VQSDRALRWHTAIPTLRTVGGLRGHVRLAPTPAAGGSPSPCCAAQFGPGAIQQHGFARNLEWGVASTSADYNPDDKDPEVELVRAALCCAVQLCAVAGSMRKAVMHPDDKDPEV